jgi:ATP-binding cassette subfamily B protein
MAIIRLALKNPALVLLDEMTARLDSATERQILSAMEALCRGRTVLAIAHRQAAMAWMDRTVHMQDGVITKDADKEATSA